MYSDSRFYGILDDYDKIGPLLSEIIYKSPENKTIAKEIYDYLNTEIVKDIDNKNFDKAIAKYVIMTYKLIERFGLMYKYLEISNNKNNDEIEKKLNKRTLGHAKTKIKTQRKKMM